MPVGCPLPPYCPLYSSFPSVSSLFAPMVGFKQAKQSRRHSAKISRPSVERLHFAACHDHYTFSDGQMVLTDRRIFADVQVLDVSPPSPSTPTPKRPCLEQLDEDSQVTSSDAYEPVSLLPGPDFIATPSPPTSVSPSSPDVPPSTESFPSSPLSIDEPPPSQRATADDGASTSGTQSKQWKPKASPAFLPFVHLREL